MSFFSELKRRNVIRVGVAYLVAAWLLLQIVDVLVRIKDLRVPSRTSSFSFKGSNKTLVEIGEALNVDHVLEGSVRKAGQKIRVTAQLNEVKTDTHLWSETFTRSFELEDIFVVQDEIAQLIVEALQLTLSLSDQQTLIDHSTQNVEAYNKFLLGRHYWNQRTAESLLSAAELLREAVEIDPGYDQAWAALAGAYVLIPEYGGGNIDEFVPLAREAVNKALAINPDSARALSTSAYYKTVYDYDWHGAEKDYKRALTLLAQRQDQGDGVFGKALQYALLKEYELTLESLEAGFAAGDPFAVHMNYIKLYDPLRDNPRFQAMLKEMNLWP